MADNKTISKLQINKTTYDLSSSEDGSVNSIEIDPAVFTIGECYNYYINEGINTFTISGEAEIPGEDSSPIGTISGKNKLILLSIKKATDAAQENLLYILCGILDRITTEDFMSSDEEASPAFCIGMYTADSDIVFGDGLTISAVNDTSDEIHTKKIYLSDNKINDQIYIACDGQTIRIGYNQNFLFPVTLVSLADNSGINVQTPIQPDNIANKSYVDNHSIDIIESDTDPIFTNKPAASDEDCGFAIPRSPLDPGNEHIDGLTNVSIISSSRHNANGDTPTKKFGFMGGYYVEGNPNSNLENVDLVIDMRYFLVPTRLNSILRTWNTDVVENDFDMFVVGYHVDCTADITISNDISKGSIILSYGDFGFDGAFIFCDESDGSIVFGKCTGGRYADYTEVYIKSDMKAGHRYTGTLVSGFTHEYLDYKNFKTYSQPS